MRWIAMILVLLPGVALATPCKDVLGRYEAKLEAAKSESRLARVITLGYLRNLERAFKKCFRSKEGLALKAARLKFIKDNPKPIRRRDAPQPRAKASTGASSNSSSSDDGTYIHMPTRPRVHPASAALFSLVIPGAGQALKNDPLPAWLFFLGASGLYAAGGGVLAAGFTVGNSRSFYKPEHVAGGAVLMGLGGVIHLISIIHAAAAKAPR